MITLEQLKQISLPAQTDINFRLQYYFQEILNFKNTPSK